MAHRTHREKITAQWVCEQVEQQDDNLAVACYKLAPYDYFGDAFHVTELADSPVVDDITPRRVTVTATVSRPLFRLMFLVQAGSEALGDDPPPWAIVEGSAKDEAGALVDPRSV